MRRLRPALAAIVALTAWGCAPSGPPLRAPRPKMAFVKSKWLRVTEADLHDPSNDRALMQDALLASARTFGTRRRLEAALGSPADDSLRCAIAGAWEAEIPKAAAFALSWVTFRQSDGCSDLITFYIDAQGRVIRTEMRSG